MKQLQEFIILSAELSTLSINENRNRTVNLFKCLKELGFNFRPIEGCYKGATEISFMVIVKDEAEIETVKDLGLKSFKQDSILFRDYKGETSLIFNNSDIMSIGRFKQVDRSIALQYDAYSVVDNNYWIVS